MIYISKPYLPKRAVFDQYLDQIWNSGILTNEGALAQQLESKLQNYLGVPFLRFVSNGTIALQIALKVLQITGEVITTPFSYVATTNAILWENCGPVFVDIDEKTLCINPDLIESAITEKTTAILATHIYGYPCDVERIGAIAKKYHLKVIYDAAHCFGVKIHGESILNYGDISTLSFHATKVFHTVEGGAIVSQTKEDDEQIWLAKKFGHVGEEDYYSVGINAKNSEFHAAMGLCLLPKVKLMIEERKKIFTIYDQHFVDLPLFRLNIPKGLEYNYSYYPIVFESKEKMLKVRDRLFENGINPRRYFYPSLNTLKFLHEYYACPISESIAERVLCLPVFYGMDLTDAKRISEIIRGKLNF
jgi:dTDP-4-amino-4,6-dideoxygalactose transaminase